MKILAKGELKASCRSCGAHFEFEPADCFVRYEVCGMIDSGTFDREEVVYVRCPTCKKRVRVTGKVPVEVVKDNRDALCKCPGDYCRCE